MARYATPHYWRLILHLQLLIALESCITTYTSGPHYNALNLLLIIKITPKYHH